MADLFGESGSADESSDTKDTSTGAGSWMRGEEEEPPAQNGSAEHMALPGDEHEDVYLGLGPGGGGGGGGGGEEAEASPRDDIRVSVVEYQKTGDDYTFDVEVEVNGRKKLVHRNYKELLWLHRNLTRIVELGGHILPPMPPPPPKAMNANIAILGTTSKSLYGDYNRYPCLAVETFLQSLSDHRFFSENNTVHTYLVNEQVEMEEKLGSGSLWSSFTKVISDMQKGGVQDPEEEFTKYLKNLDELAPRLLAAAKSFSQMVTSMQGLAVAESLLAKMLTEHSRIIGYNQDYSIVVDKAAKAMEESKTFLVSSSFDGRHTIGFTFEHYNAYCTQVKEMLHRRLTKLQTLLSCNAQLDKAKPEKKEAAEKAKNDADKAFRSISDTAKREMEFYTEQYVEAFRGNLLGYAESQIHHSRKTYESLSIIRSELVATVVS